MAGDKPKSKNTKKSKSKSESVSNKETQKSESNTKAAEKAKPATKKEDTTTNSATSEKTKSSTTTNKRGVKIKVKTLLATIIIGAVLAILYVNRGQFVVATVNGQPITRWEVVSDLEDQYAEQTLQNLITQRLIEQEAQKLGITVTDEDLQQEIQNIENDFAAQGSSLEAALALQGLTIDDVKSGIKTQLYVQRIVGDNVAEISDEEAQQFIENNELGEPTPELVAQTKEQLMQQKVFQESQLWLQQIREAANINYYLYDAPQQPLQ